MKEPIPINGYLDFCSRSRIEHFYVQTPDEEKHSNSEKRTLFFDSLNRYGGTKNV